MLKDPFRSLSEDLIGVLWGSLDNSPSLIPPIICFLDKPGNASFLSILQSPFRSIEKNS